ncbi:hypothetical protein P4N68_01185 [Corynebacterium felinum]|uniref:DUF11 domain-containing protein n=1 Tax=Corynebacterium felinum TaxID=131318 RepID=A0ABU2BAG7_9CORY|nr:hypothetical protein [Corynebacterium felinum]MDF5819693.1 hypothetical protein [Corynebacterium felinum]MDR7355590.1 hypothetical protein [Corynebacterium felinum]WJY94940.1 hypothetical protein CFELI_06615 [Corynebacterium felinum]
MLKRFSSALIAGLLTVVIVTPAQAQNNRLVAADCQAVDVPVSISVTRNGQTLDPQAPVQENDELTYTFKIKNNGEPDSTNETGPIFIDRFRVDGVDDQASFDKITWPNPAKEFVINIGETATAIFPGYKVTAMEVSKGKVTRTFEIPVSTTNGNSNTCSVLLETSHTLPRPAQSSNGPLIGGIVAAIAAVLAVVGGVVAWFARLIR